MNKSSHYMGLIQNFRNDSKHIIIGDNFYSTDFNKTKEYFEGIKGNKLKEIKALKKADNNKNESNSEEEKKEVDIDVDKYSFSFIDYDNEHNSYWSAEEVYKEKEPKNFAIVIFSKHGDLLDAFYYAQLHRSYWNTELYQTSGAIPAVAPNRDGILVVRPIDSK